MFLNKLLIRNLQCFIERLLCFETQSLRLLYDAIGLIAYLPECMPIAKYMFSGGSVNDVLRIVSIIAVVLFDEILFYTDWLLPWENVYFDLRSYTSAKNMLPLCLLNTSMNIRGTYLVAIFNLKTSIEKTERMLRRNFILNLLHKTSFAIYNHKKRSAKCTQTLRCLEKKSWNGSVKLKTYMIRRQCVREKRDNKEILN